MLTFLRVGLFSRNPEKMRNSRYASSKICHACGYVHKELTLSDRTWSCPSCGAQLNRDQNAAINIKEAGTALLAW